MSEVKDLEISGRDSLAYFDISVGDHDYVPFHDAMKSCVWKACVANPGSNLVDSAETLAEPSAILKELAFLSLMSCVLLGWFLLTLAKAVEVDEVSLLVIKYSPKNGASLLSQ